MFKISKEIKSYSYLAFLVFVLGYVIFQLYVKSHLPKLGWTISDWLINYEDGGFKRRGLSGSFLFFIQDHLKIALNTQIFIIQSFFFILIFYFIIKLILSKILNWNILILLCSPLCLLYIPVNIFNSGRKEIILIALLSFFVYGKMDRAKEYILFIGYILGLFLHELFYFYLPFVMAAHILKTRKIELKYLVSLFFISTTVMLILFFFGNGIQQGQTLEILKYRGVELDKWNIFTYDAARERKEMILAYKSYILFALELFFMIFLYFMYIKRYLPQRLKVFRIFTCISLIWMIPLYYMGADWFRWNHIYSLLFIILIIALMPENTEKKPIVEGRPNITLIVVNVIFFVIFFLHIKYDSSGNSTEFFLPYLNKIKPLFD